MKSSLCLTPLPLETFWLQAPAPHTSAQIVFLPFPFFSCLLSVVVPYSYEIFYPLDYPTLEPHFNFRLKTVCDHIWYLTATEDYT
jgi:hypothetical protein